MSIISFTVDVAGQIDCNPRRPKLVCTDLLAAVITPGFINNTALSAALMSTDVVDAIYAFDPSTNEGTYGEFSVAISGGIVTLSLEEGTVILPVVDGDFAIFSGTKGAMNDRGYSPTNAAKTKVVMADSATVANHLMVSTDTSGTVGNKTGTAINDGSLQAGRSTVAGSLISYPATATKGSLQVTAVANTGDTVTTLSNAAMGQASTISIPDPGLSASNVLLTNSAGTQTIATGNLTLTLGNLTVAAGNIAATAGSITATAGNVQAGSSGNAGTVKSFPSTASKGSLALVGVANAGDTITTISNASMGQATVVSIPDPGTATANFAVAPAALVSGNLIKASGTAGAVADVGAKIIANTTPSFAGGGTTNTFTATGLTSAAKGSAVIRASTNSVSITKALPGTDILVITFSADPGASTTVDYIYSTAAI